jgi:hypothetical protein
MRARYFREATHEQVSWGSCQDPRGVLTVGETYEVENVEEHSWHTKIHLVGYPGRGFNKISFEEVDDES